MNSLRSPWRVSLTAGAAVAALLMARPAPGQVAESTTDPYGIGLPYPFVHIVHADDDSLIGGSAYFRRYDPFLFFVLGRDFVRRKFTFRQGVYGQTGEASVPLYVGPSNARGAATHGGVPRFARDHTSSCGACHSIPYPEPGGGQTIASTGSMGRNTPHFFGAGLVEMIAQQTRQKILNRYDRNGNGAIDRAEVAESSPIRIAPSPGARPVDYGDLAPDEHGVPQMNGVFRIWYLDASGRVLPDASSLDDPHVAAFNFAMQPFGWGRGYLRGPGGRRIAQGAEASTVRQFYVAAADVHMGLEAYDPSQLVRYPEAEAKLGSFGGVAQVSLNGALQFDFGDMPDRGLRIGPTGLSLDDPDGDGHINELTEGDVDAVEFYMLHVPTPATRAAPAAERGRRVFHTIECANCHVESWRIEGQDAAKGFSGDRRLFHLETTSYFRPDGGSELVGRLVPLYRRGLDGAHEPLGGAYAAEGLYGDFKHWDIGEGFHERRYDGSLQRTHRTPALWGVGSTAPYGHSGQYLTIDQAVRAHDGAAATERKAYVALPQHQRRDLLAFLESLVLFVSDEFPTDLNGDGTVAEHFVVDGQDVGYERFDPRLLARTPPRFRFLRDVAHPNGRTFRLQLIENPREVYGLDLPHRRDSDGNGFPDVVDPGPGSLDTGTP